MPAAYGGTSAASRRTTNVRPGGAGMRDIPHNSRFDDRVVLVTGAASGIGRASAIAFAQLGASLSIADKDAGGLAETTAAVVAAGAEALQIVADVTQRDDVAEMVARTVGEL